MEKFVFHMDYADMVKMLPDADRLCLYDSLLSFAAADGAIAEPKTNNLAVLFMYRVITARMIADHDKFVRKCEENRKNGNLGGRPKGSKDSKPRKRRGENDLEISEKTERFLEKPSGFIEKPRKTLYDYDSDFDSEYKTDYRPDHRPDRAEPSVSQSASERNQLQATADQALPTLDEVLEFFHDKPRETVIKAYNFYQNNGWKDSSGSPVRNWQKVIAVFIDNERPDRQTRQTRRKSGWDFKGRNQDYDKIALQLIQQQNAELDALEGGQYDDDRET